MAAFLKCFGIRRSEDEADADINKKMGTKKHHHKLHCPRCKCKMVEEVEEDGTDGNMPCSKFTLSKRGSQVESNSGSGSTSVSTSNSSSQDASPTREVPNGNSGNYIYDYRPSAQGGIAGMSYMPVSKTDPNYNMNHVRRGKAVIFNFDVWKNTAIPSLELQPRLGSQKDKEDLARCLTNLSFDVTAHDNLARQKFDKVLDKLRKEDHSDADCIVIAIMSHGEKNTFYLSDGTQLPVNLIWEKFEANNCPTLAGKPKIFLIQACRGKRYDHGTMLAGAGQITNMHNDVTDFVPFSYVIPNAADIIVAFSCPLGHYSWRSPEKGSWFIQSICKVFNQHAYDMDLKSLLTTVSREVALNFESDTDHIDSNKKKQVPSTSSTLIRNVWFWPKPAHVTAQNGVCAAVENDAGLQANNVFSLQTVRQAVAEAQSSASVAGSSLLVEELNSPLSSETLPLVVSMSSSSGVENLASPQSSEGMPALMQSDGGSGDEIRLILDDTRAPPAVGDPSVLPCQ